MFFALIARDAVPPVNLECGFGFDLHSSARPRYAGQEQSCLLSLYPQALGITAQPCPSQNLQTPRARSLSLLMVLLTSRSHWGRPVGSPGATRSHGR